MVGDSLNVGCGFTSFAGVNVDVDRSVLPDLVCDGMYLPFKDKAFERVFCFQVIEHVVDPFRLVRECLRVCWDKVIVRCPHYLGDKFRGNKWGHRHFFSRRWFNRYFNVVFSRVYEYLCPVPFCGLLRLPLDFDGGS